MDIFTKCYQHSFVDELRERDLFPYFRELQSRQDTEVIMEGKRRIMLGSNNYLGLTTNPEIIAAAHKALDEYGTGCSGSRLLNGTLNLHLDFEREMAEFLRKGDVVTFSTGFQSNLGIISAIVGMRDYMICDRENHASIYDACRLSYGKMLRYRHSDMADLERCLQKVPEDRAALIITDGVFSMGGDIAKLPEITTLAKKYGARHGRRCARLRRHRRGRPRQRELFRSGAGDRHLHGDVLEVDGLARRLYGGGCARVRLRPLQFPAVHLFGECSAREYRRRHGGAAPPEGAPGAAAAVA